MTRKEAFEILREYTFSGFYITNATFQTSPGKWHEAMTMAVAALREQESMNENAPLTLDELRQMDGEPVWCPEHEIWGIVKVGTVGRWKEIPFLIGHWRSVNCEWDIERRQLKLYHHKPGGRAAKGRREQ